MLCASVFRLFSHWHYGDNKPENINLEYRVTESRIGTEPLQPRRREHPTPQPRAALAQRGPEHPTAKSLLKYAY